MTRASVEFDELGGLRALWIALFRYAKIEMLPVQLIFFESEYLAKVLSQYHLVDNIP